MFETNNLNKDKNVGPVSVTVNYDGLSVEVTNITPERLPDGHYTLDPNSKTYNFVYVPGRLYEYIITAKTWEDDTLYYELETEGIAPANTDITRSVECVAPRPISRNTHYLLTGDEVEQLKNDDRILAIELHPKYRGFKITNKENSSTQTSSYWNKTNASTAINNNSKNWALLRCTESTPRTGWGYVAETFHTDATAFNYPATFLSALHYNIDQSITSSGTINLQGGTGKNVDVVICDGGGLEWNHPEFAKNTDGTGGTRTIQYNWYNHDPEVKGTTPGLYDYTSYQNKPDDHPTHVAGTVAGNTQGWARNANIYNISYNTGNIWSGGDLSPFDYIRAWHNSKSINSVTGIKNPTIVNNSWGYSTDLSWYTITNLKYRGVETTLPLDVSNSLLWNVCSASKEVLSLSGNFGHTSGSAVAFTIRTGGSQPNMSANIVTIPSDWKKENGTALIRDMSHARMFAGQNRMWNSYKITSNDLTAYPCLRKDTVYVQGPGRITVQTAIELGAIMVATLNPNDTLNNMFPQAGIPFTNLALAGTDGSFTCDPITLLPGEVLGVFGYIPAGFSFSYKKKYLGDNGTITKNGGDNVVFNEKFRVGSVVYQSGNSGPIIGFRIYSLIGEEDNFPWSFNVLTQVTSSVLTNFPIRRSLSVAIKVEIKNTLTNALVYTNIPGSLFDISNISKYGNFWPVRTYGGKVEGIDLVNGVYGVPEHQYIAGDNQVYAVSIEYILTTGFSFSTMAFLDVGRFQKMVSISPVADTTTASYTSLTYRESPSTAGYTMVFSPTFTYKAYPLTETMSYDVMVGGTTAGHAYHTISLPFNVTVFSQSYNSLIVTSTSQILFGTPTDVDSPTWLGLYTELTAYGYYYPYDYMKFDSSATPFAKLNAGVYNSFVTMILYTTKGTAPNRTFELHTLGIYWNNASNGSEYHKEYVFYENDPTRIDTYTHYSPRQAVAFIPYFTVEDLYSYKLPFISTDITLPIRVAAIDADKEDCLKAGIHMVGAAGNSAWYHATPEDADWSNELHSTDYPTEVFYYSQGGSPNGGRISTADTPCISVGALGPYSIDGKAYFSDMGPGVDIWAPGWGIISSILSVTYYASYLSVSPDPRNSAYKIMSMQGTSMASPQVTGVLACALENYPTMTPAQGKQFILNNADTNMISYASNQWPNGTIPWLDLQDSPNRILKYKQERPTDGGTYPKKNYFIRPTVGQTWPRVRKKRYK